MPDAELMTAVVHAYIGGFERGDADALTQLFAEDATVEDPVGTPIKRGKAEIREFYGFSISTGAKLELMGDPRCAGDYIAFPFKVKLDFEGQSSAIEVIDTFRINESGKIAEMRAFWGPANMKSA
jgi:steroid Delta-isomerase